MGWVCKWAGYNWEVSIVKRVRATQHNNNTTSTHSCLQFAQSALLISQCTAASHGRQHGTHQRYGMQIFSFFFFIFNKKMRQHNNTTTTTTPSHTSPHLFCRALVYCTGGGGVMPSLCTGSCSFYHAERVCGHFRTHRDLLL